jgi:UDP-glucose 4-epimerase
MLVKRWGGDIAVRFSGVVRAGDPFSLIADDAQLRGVSFGWKIPADQGVAEYVPWFKEYVR